MNIKSLDSHEEAHSAEIFLLKSTVENHSTENLIFSST